MELIWIRSQIRTVAERWHRQYPNETEKYGALLRLNVERATAKHVEEIIGNNSWAQEQTCDECQVASKFLVRVGQEPDYDSSTASICRACLIKAIGLIENRK